MLGTAELETIIHDNKLPALIEETGQTWLRVRLTDPQTGLSETLAMGLSDFADLILHWRAMAAMSIHVPPWWRARQTQGIPSDGGPVRG